MLNMKHHLGMIKTFLAVSVFFPALIAAVAARTAAQTAPVFDVPKGQHIVLKIPGKLIGFDRVSTWSGSVSYGAIVEQNQKGGIVVGGLSEWRTAGWSLMRQLTFEKISREKTHTVVELRDSLFNIKLRFDNSVKDLNAAFREIAFFGLLADFEKSDHYRKEIIGKVLPTIFAGDLASIPTARKMKLLEQLRYVESAISYEKYKGGGYLSINVGGDTEIYNTLRVDQARRIGHSLNQRVLSYFKRVARTVKFHPDIDGIKISIFIPYKDFINEAYLQPGYDHIEIYSPMDVIQQFADDELTNQEFMEESILLVNGNRMQIPNLESL